MMHSVEYDEGPAGPPPPAAPAVDFDEDETEGFDEWISSLNHQLHEDSLWAKKGKALKTPTTP